MTAARPPVIARVWALLLVALVAILSLSQPAAAQSGSDTASFSERVTRWTNTLDSVAQQLRQSGLSRSEIAPLNENLEVIQKSAAAARERAMESAQAQKELLNALGKPPAEGDPPENPSLAAARAEIKRELARYEDRRKQSELLLARISALLGRLVSAQYTALYNLLTEPSALPLAPSTLDAAGTQLQERLDDVAESVRQWWAGTTEVRPKPLLILAAVLGAGLFSRMWLRYWLQRRQSRVPLDQLPSRGQRFVVAMLYIVESALLPALMILALSRALLWQPLFNTELDQQLGGLLLMIARFIFILGLVTAVLAPNEPRWRISDFTDDAALRLYRAVRLYAFITIAMLTVVVLLNPATQVAANVSEEALTTYFSVYPELSATSSMLVLLIVNLALLHVLRPRNWRLRVYEPTRDGDTERAPYWSTRLALSLARIAIVASLLLGVFGYLSAGVYLTDRIGSTLGLVGLAMLVRTLLGAGLHHSITGNSHVGGRLRQRLALDDSGAARLEFWLLLTIDTVILVGGMLLLLLLWGMPAAELQRLTNLLLYGVAIGEFTLSVVDVGIAIGVFVLIFTVVRLTQGFLAMRVLTQTGLDIGARNAVTTVIGYVGLMIAALVALSLLGIDFSQLALILGALSIGIGFGLQHVVSNFVSGLILLAQRPIKSGDWIVVGAHQGYVKHISVIATEIQTFDNAAVLVPNSTLVSSEVLNWTHKSTLGRVILGIRTGFEVEPEQVRDILLACAKENVDVLSRPAPWVLFMQFGQSALEFELRFFIREIDNYLVVASDLRYALNKAFAEAGISIPYPQQDIHVRDAGPWSQATRDSTERTVDTAEMAKDSSSRQRSRSPRAALGGDPGGGDSV